MEVSLEHSDFLLQDLWHWLLQVEICVYELQEAMLAAGKRPLTSKSDAYFLSGTCLVSNLENLKRRIQREIMKAAKDYCPDSLYETKAEDDIHFWEVGSDESLASFLKCIKILISDAKTCINDLRLVAEETEKLQHMAIDDSPKLEWKDGKWIRTYRGRNLEDPESLDINAFGRLRKDFEKQSSNIMVLEKERNALSIEVAKLKKRLKTEE